MERNITISLRNKNKKEWFVSLKLTIEMETQERKCIDLVSDDTCNITWSTRNIKEIRTVKSLTASFMSGILYALQNTNISRFTTIFIFICLNTGFITIQRMKVLMKKKVGFSVTDTENKKLGGVMAIKDTRKTSGITNLMEIT